MKFSPVRDRMVVQLLEAATTTAGGIVIPDAATEKPNRGKVIAVGTGHLTKEGKVIPLEVKAGDTVLFGQHAGQNVKIDGQEYLILKEDDVMAVIEE